MLSPSMLCIITLGCLVYSGRVLSAQTSLDQTPLSPGIYIIQALGENTQHVKRIVKQ
jgi:hypothetical protein